MYKTFLFCEYLNKINMQVDASVVNYVYDYKNEHEKELHDLVFFVETNKKMKKYNFVTPILENGFNIFYFIKRKKSLEKHKMFYNDIKSVKDLLEYGFKMEDVSVENDGIYFYRFTLQLKKPLQFDHIQTVLMDDFTPLNDFKICIGLY